MRLLWQLLLALTPLAALAYMAWGGTSGRPRLWLFLAIGVAATAGALSVFLLIFDPRWTVLRVGNLPLFIVLAGVAIAAVLTVLRSQIPKP